MRGALLRGRRRATTGRPAVVRPPPAQFTGPRPLEERQREWQEEQCAVEAQLRQQREDHRRPQDQSQPPAPAAAAPAGGCCGIEAPPPRAPPPPPVVLPPPPPPEPPASPPPAQLLQGSAVSALQRVIQAASPTGMQADAAAALAAALAASQTEQLRARRFVTRVRLMGVPWNSSTRLTCNNPAPLPAGSPPDACPLKTSRPFTLHPNLAPQPQAALAARYVPGDYLDLEVDCVDELNALMVGAAGWFGGGGQRVFGAAASRVAGAAERSATAVEHARVEPRAGVGWKAGRGFPHAPPRPLLPSPASRLSRRCRRR
jgi:hypothetical protein